MSAGVDEYIDGTEYVDTVKGTKCMYDPNITCNSDCSNCPVLGK